MREWVQARSPYALASLLFGVLAMVDFCTPLAWVMGPAAIVLGVLGLRDLGRRSDLVGKRLCVAGIVCGAAGLTLSITLLILH